MQEVGKFSLKNDGGFVVKLQFVYYDENGIKHHVDGTEGYPVLQSKTVDPGDYGVPENSLVSLYAFVVWGTDNQATQLFLYKKGNKRTANYRITGTTLNNDLQLIDIS